jgi:hypothetical protein
MTDPIRLTKATIKETITSDDSTKPAAEQKQTQSGIGSTTDSFEVKQDSSLFTLSRDTGEVKFGDGLSGKRPPEGTSAAMLYQSKAEISGYLKGEAKSQLLATKNYLLDAQNKQIDNQMKEAGEKAQTAMNQANTEMSTGIVGGLVTIGSAINNLKYAAAEAKSNLANNPALEARYKHFTSTLNELEVAVKPQSKSLQQKANQADAETKRLENQAQKDSDFAKESSAHRDRIRDAVLDFIRKLGEIDPKI